MPFTFVYRTAGFSALSKLLRESADISSARYTNVNSIISFCQSNMSKNLIKLAGRNDLMMAGGLLVVHDWERRHYKPILYGGTKNLNLFQFLYCVDEICMCICICMF